MPASPAEARTWMDRQEAGDRKNARVMDKVRLALPRELSHQQRAELVAEFAKTLTGGRVPWFAATHQTGKDAYNPHCHLVIRDRDIETGRRVLRLSDSARERQNAGMEPKAVDWVRERWEVVCNRSLERIGVNARIDRRTLVAQGIDREPTIHIGPRAQHIENQVQRPESRARQDRRGRVIDYPMIDAGRTRKERHAEIVDLNLERAARSPDFETRERAKWERDQRAKDIVLERTLTAEARRRTLEKRRVIGLHRVRFTELRRQEAAERGAAVAKVREKFSPALASLKERHASERIALRDRESTVWRRVAILLDFTGKARSRRDENRRALGGLQKQERTDLGAQYRQSRSIQIQAVQARYKPQRSEIITERTFTLGIMKDRHGEAEAKADRARQAREAERERDREMLDRTMRLVKDRIAGPSSSPRGLGRERGPSL
jgi:hypothetical protein